MTSRWTLKADASEQACFKGAVLYVHHARMYSTTRCTLGRGTGEQGAVSAQSIFSRGLLDAKPMG